MTETFNAWAPYVMGANLVIVNVAFAFLLRTLGRAISLKDVLREKTPSAQTSALANAEALVKAEAPAASAAATPTAALPDATSFSRVSGLLGSVVLAGFIWGLSNVVLFQAFADPGKISDLLTGTSTFILSSSALFAPYAFNSLKSLGPKQSN